MRLNSVVSGATLKLGTVLLALLVLVGAGNILIGYVIFGSILTGIGLGGLAFYTNECLNIYEMLDKAEMIVIHVKKDGDDDETPSVH